MYRFFLCFVVFLWSCTQLSVAATLYRAPSNNYTLSNNLTETLENCIEIFPQLNFTELLHYINLLNNYTSAIASNLTEILETHKNFFTNLPFTEILNNTNLLNNYNSTVKNNLTESLENCNNIFTQINFTEIIKNTTLLDNYNLALRNNFTHILKNYELFPRFNLTTLFSDNSSTLRNRLIKTLVRQALLLFDFRNTMPTQNDTDITYIESNCTRNDYNETINGETFERRPRTLSLLWVLDLILARIIANMQAQNPQEV